MNKFIERDKAIEVLKTAEVHVSGIHLGKTIFSQYSERYREALVGAVAAVPVERDLEYVRHGYWVTLGKTEGGSNILECSYCGKVRRGIAKSTYCRDCGAKMDWSEECGFLI